jgi:hypothetical protein
MSSEELVGKGVKFSSTIAALVRKREDVAEEKK